MVRSTKPILIAGPTASGKSALALALVERCDGVVINADSMQVYTELPVLTAQPSAADRARAPHRLYGHIPARESYSVARYMADAAAEIERVQASGQRPIIVGGTGLYFMALLEGLSPVPEIPGGVRAHWRHRAQAIPAEDLHRELAERDAEMASRLKPADRQRVTRALEVIEATGRSLADWQAVPGVPILSESETVRLVVDIGRAAIQQRCDQRFDIMIGAGALDEVESLMRQNLSTELPAMRALGVRPLAEHLAGRASLTDAVAQAKLETRQYAKRQATWLKRHMIAWQHVNSEQMHSLGDLMRIFIDVEGVPSR
jgi:tRNA dimethylallyltransferase